MRYYFYILRCSDNSLYCGITNDLTKRLKNHNNSKGAKYVRSKLPAELVYSEKLTDKVSAMKREAEIKKWSKLQKETLVKTGY